MIPFDRGYKIGELFRCGVLKQYDKEKKFKNGRSFIVFIYGATNVFGLVGSEANGVGILDKDNNLCVLDCLMVESSGYYGPKKSQIDEFNKIMVMNWNEFKNFVNNNKRSRIKIVSKDKIEYNPQPY